MQRRHTDRTQYFDELSVTSRKYYVPYIEKFRTLGSHCNVLEIGCGEGGNLIPFYEKGCRITGVDLSVNRIKQAREFFDKKGIEGNLLASDIFSVNTLQETFDIVLIHDVIEHIADKISFLEHIKRFLKPDGILFFGFPAWQMPFGGHQQIGHSPITSRLPFVHLLPGFLYPGFLKLCGETPGYIEELKEIKKCRTSIECFRKVAGKTAYKIIDERFYFINPHYEIKFGMRPRLLSSAMGKIPYLRNFFVTSCFYLLTCNDQ